MELLPMTSNNIFIEMITLADLDKALSDTVIYERVKDVLFRLLKGEVLNVSVKLVEDKTLNQLFFKLLEDAHTVLVENLKGDVVLKEILNKVKKDEDLFKKLYKDLDNKQELLTKLRAAVHGDAFDELLDTALLNALDAWSSRLKNDKVNLLKILQTEALQRDNIDYYLEVSKVINWFSFEYCQCADSTKEFVKKHISTIVESNHPNKTLERLQLFHLYQRHNKRMFFREDTERFREFLDTSLDHLEAFEHLIGNTLPTNPGYPRVENIVLDNLNLEKISAFIENPSFSPLEILTEPPELINFFTFLIVLWWALVNRNNNSQPLIARVTAAFEETQNKNKEYKTYWKKLSESIKEFQEIYNSGLNRLTLKILDEKGEVKSDIDFKALADDLCALSYLYCFGIKIVKTNPIMDKFFEKFNYPNMVDPLVRDKLDVLFWIYKGFYGNMDSTGKKFIQEHLDKIMGCDRPKEALNALHFICFYKLHDKTNTNDIIDAVIKNNSPESFFKEFMSRLVSLNEHPNLLKEYEISSVLDALLVQCSQSSTNGASEIITLKKEANIPSQNRPITAWCSFYGCEGHRSLDSDIRVINLMSNFR